MFSFFHCVMIESLPFFWHLQEGYVVVKCVCGFTLLQAVAVEVTAPFLAISSSNERAH